MNSRLRREIADQAAQFASVRHAVAIDADNHVAGSQADSRGRRTRKYLADDGALCRARMERRREILGQVLRYDAKLSALDFSVRDQFRKNLLSGSRGNRKAEADAAARRTDDSAVDADHAPIEVQQRTTGIARVDGGIRLDVPS